MGVQVGIQNKIVWGYRLEFRGVQVEFSLGEFRKHSFGLQQSFWRSSKAPVPPLTTRPATRHAEGERMGSVSPASVALFKKCMVVSKLIFWKGELLVSIPMRLKGL